MDSYRKTRIVIASAFALLAQSAISGEAPRAAGRHEEIRVTLPSQWAAPAVPEVKLDLRPHIEALNRRLQRDLARHLESMRDARIELVITEVPTRG